MTPATYVECKAALKALLADTPAALFYVDYLQGNGQTIYEHACAMGIEGIVSKAKDSPYRAGRQDPGSSSSASRAAIFRLSRSAGRAAASRNLKNQALSPPTASWRARADEQELITYWRRVSKEALKYLGRRPGVKISPAETTKAEQPILFNQAVARFAKLKLEALTKRAEQAKQSKG
jgi:hypothetical protein